MRLEAELTGTGLQLLADTAAETEAGTVVAETETCVWFGFTFIEVEFIIKFKLWFSEKRTSEGFKWTELEVDIKTELEAMWLAETGLEFSLKHQSELEEELGEEREEGVEERDEVLEGEQLFARFIRWPSSKFGGSFLVGVLRGSPSLEASGFTSLLSAS